MTDRITVVTPPDDISQDAIRLLLIDLNPDHMQVLSTALMTSEIDLNVITYFWKTSEDTDWLFDKKFKADLIFFNADSDNDIVVGYMAAQKNSYYFGTLKILSKVNISAIYDVEQILSLLDDTARKYEKR
jgi:hypothetical protein